MPPQKLGTRYMVHGTIGKGKFSRVRYCTTTDTNESFALRIIDKHKLEEHGLLEDMKNEITIMRMLKHENIISVRDMFASQTRVFLVLDLMVGGNLQTKISREGPLPMRKTRFYFQQLYRGVEYLHSMGVTHGNLRLENLLLDSDGCLKISDFSVSTIFDYTTSELTADNKQRSLLSRILDAGGSPHYVSPEMIENKEVIDGKKSDIWSMGVILYTMFMGYPPFTNDDNIATAEVNRSALLDLIRSGRPKPYPDTLPSDAVGLLQSMLTVDPNRRTTLSQMRVNSWLKLESMSFAAAAPWIPQQQQQWIDMRTGGSARGLTQENDCESGVFRFLCNPFGSFNVFGASTATTTASAGAAGRQQQQQEESSPCDGDDDSYVEEEDEGPRSFLKASSQATIVRQTKPEEEENTEEPKGPTHSIDNDNSSGDGGNGAVVNNNSSSDYANRRLSVEDGSTVSDLDGEVQSTQ